MTPLHIMRLCAAGRSGCWCGCGRVQPSEQDKHWVLISHLEYWLTIQTSNITTSPYPLSCNKILPSYNLKYFKDSQSSFPQLLQPVFWPGNCRPTGVCCLYVDSFGCSHIIWPVNTIRIIIILILNMPTQWLTVVRLNQRTSGRTDLQQSTAAPHSFASLQLQRMRFQAVNFAAVPTALTSLIKKGSSTITSQPSYLTGH